MLLEGSRWVVSRGMGEEADLLHTEDGAGSRAEGDRVRVYFKAFSVVIGLV